MFECMETLMEPDEVRAELAELKEAQWHPKHCYRHIPGYGINRWVRKYEEELAGL